MHEVRRSLSPIFELPVVAHQQMHEQDLDLVRREEPSGTRVHPVTEGVVLRARRHELEPVLAAGGLSPLVEAQAVVDIRGGVDGRVLEDVGGDEHACALGDARAVGKGDLFRGEAVEKGWWMLGLA